ncbi:hypothetical protein GKQ77_01825 [Streptomyces sp. BG9H]|uniref:Uncharacterized protein n=1 Tax=Streptomyces anatolicus TaxID=2675858 RepID=A0ABS6YFX0_9ACTN|nr:hypothetical protein [Streptomyces anatolicus]MBW5420310.1 hypothetical protein [Streptomyces anatolicus]
MTTPADELRTAAATLRVHAAAAAEDSGNTTWHTTRHFPDQPNTTYTTVWATDGKPLLRGGGGRGRPHPYVSAPVGDYIAAMDPAVGLALADWLDATAARLQQQAHPDWQDTVEPQALAVARAINGRQP